MQREAQGGPVPPRRKPAPVDTGARQQFERNVAGGMGRAIMIAAISLAATIGLMVLIVGPPMLRRPILLEQKELSDVSMQLRLMDRQALQAALPGARGFEFWRDSMEAGLLDHELRWKLVSRNSRAGNIRAGMDDRLLPNNCSFTAPAALELSWLLGQPDIVLVTFNVLNWHNYPDRGVLVIWADREIAEWLTQDDAQDRFGITPEEWADPAGKLFGKKAPFQYTFE